MSHVHPRDLRAGDRVWIAGRPGTVIRVWFLCSWQVEIRRDRGRGGGGTFSFSAPEPSVRVLSRFGLEV